MKKLTEILKIIPKSLGLNRAGLSRFWFRLNCAFPIRYLTVWLVRPGLALLWLRNKFFRRVIVCYPEIPAEFGYEIAKLSMILGFKLRLAAKQPALGLTWQDITIRKFSTPNTARYFLNHRCTDISKNRVEEVFEAVFGYPLRIDPLNHRGLAIRKSTINGKHDGEVIQCPLTKTEPDNVYQRLVNNQLNDHQALDLRTPVYRGNIPVIYKKLRPIKTRFGNDNDAVTIAQPDSVYTSGEREAIACFCRAFGLDYGGLDILRDKDDGRIYIVDVNYTPFGPPVELTTFDRAHALARLAAAFHKNYVTDFSSLMNGCDPTPGSKI